MSTWLSSPLVESLGYRASRSVSNFVYPSRWLHGHCEITLQRPTLTMSKIVALYIWNTAVCARVGNSWMHSSAYVRRLCIRIYILSAHKPQFSYIFMISRCWVLHILLPSGISYLINCVDSMSSCPRQNWTSCITQSYPRQLFQMK